MSSHRNRGFQVIDSVDCFVGYVQDLTGSLQYMQRSLAGLHPIILIQACRCTDICKPMWCIPKIDRAFIITIEVTIGRFFSEGINNPLRPAGEATSIPAEAPTDTVFWGTRTDGPAACLGAVVGPWRLPELPDLPLQPRRRSAERPQQRTLPPSLSSSLWSFVVSAVPSSPSRLQLWLLVSLSM